MAFSRFFASIQASTTGRNRRFDLPCALIHSLSVSRFTRPRCLPRFPALRFGACQHSHASSVLLYSQTYPGMLGNGQVRRGLFLVFGATIVGVFGATIVGGFFGPGRVGNGKIFPSVPVAGSAVDSSSWGSVEGCAGAIGRAGKCPAGSAWSSAGAVSLGAARC